MPINEDHRRWFLKNTLGLDDGYRLGGTLYHPSHYPWLEQLFDSLMQDDMTCRLLQQLANWDMYTYRHSFDVFLLGSLLAHQLAWPNRREIARGLLLHDIGKTAIPRSVLTKPDTPTLPEWTLLQTHARQGYDILTSYGFSDTVACMAHSHHERLDGRGYPDGKAASDLRHPERLLAVVDVYSALSLDRPYLPAVPPHRAMHTIRDEVGSLDSRYVRALGELLGIFPVGATVQLTNGATAVVIAIEEAFPTLPFVRNSQTKESFFLPIDQTIQVHQWIDPL